MSPRPRETKVNCNGTYKYRIVERGRKKREKKKKTFIRFTHKLSNYPQKKKTKTKLLLISLMEKKKNIT